MEEIRKTPYEWAIEREIRFVGLEKHPDDEHLFYTAPCLESTFDAMLGNSPKGVAVKSGKLHLKSEKYLELRMYTLVPYNLLGIQMGIQHEHSVTDYANSVGTKFNRWASEWKTSIVLNGGTSNEGHNVRHGFRDVWYIGSMQQNLAKLKEAGIEVSTFYEPDLNSMLTGISFIVDERVFKRKLYKDFVKTPEPENGFASIVQEELYESENMVNYAFWTEKIGGEQNMFLRNFLKNIPLAKG